MFEFFFFSDSFGLGTRFLFLEVVSLQKKQHGTPRKKFFEKNIACKKKKR